MLEHVAFFPKPVSLEALAVHLETVL
jgi:hypothetical protein